VLTSDMLVLMALSLAQISRRWDGDVSNELERTGRVLVALTCTVLIRYAAVAVHSSCVSVTGCSGTP
jgi:hypothetical protein